MPTSARARNLLINELGAQPGAELRELHQQILREDPSLAVPASALLTVGGHAGMVKPRELPASVAHFAGRASELAALTALLDRDSEHDPGTIMIPAIGGTAGVGKTKSEANTPNRYCGPATIHG
jgi:hypothetical protein